MWRNKAAASLNAWTVCSRALSPPGGCLVNVQYGLRTNNSSDNQSSAYKLLRTEFFLWNIERKIHPKPRIHLPSYVTKKSSESSHFKTRKQRQFGTFVSAIELCECWWDSGWKTKVPVKRFYLNNILMMLIISSYILRAITGLWETA